jgi:hypothetical protein
MTDRPYFHRGRLWTFLHMIGATTRLFDWLGGALYWVVVVLVADAALQADDRPRGFSLTRLRLRSGRLPGLLARNRHICCVTSLLPQQPRVLRAGERSQANGSFSQSLRHAVGD